MRRAASPTRPAWLASRRAAVLFALGLGLAFAALVGSHVHGFSISGWHELIDGSPPVEILFGEPRAIRSDDWRVQLPLAFAQAAHDPRFPRANDRIGLGQSALLPIELPVADPLVAFHPTMWGFFLGDDTGMAWLWWSRIFGLFAVWTLVFRVVTRGRSALSAAGAAALCFSPFFQFWSFNGAPQAMAMGGAFVATVALARAERPLAIAASALLLGYAGACFALAMYPPFQVPLAWLYLALVVGFWRDARSELDLRRHGSLRAAALAAAVTIALAAVGTFVWEARDAIERMRHTVYPGQRLAMGGERPLWQLLNANLAAPLWSRDWGVLLNVCEAASFWMFAPVVIAFWCWRHATGGERFDRFATSVAVFWGVLLLYVTIGLPEVLARASLLSMVPGRRAVLGVGLADGVLLMRFLGCAAPARMLPPSKTGSERRAAIALGALWALALAVCALGLLGNVPGGRLQLLLLVAAANGAFAVWLLAARKRSLPAVALALASLVTTVWFNPLVLGGAEYVKGNELSQRILAIDRAAGGETTWVAFGSDEIANLFRALGVRSINGTHTLPQLELWARIDPGGRALPIYDRYAHVVFVAAPNRSPRFILPSEDYVILRIDPASPELRKLGATHALFRGDERERAAFERMAGYEYLGSVGKNHLYRLPALPADRPGD